MIAVATAATVDIRTMTLNKCPTYRVLVLVLLCERLLIHKKADAGGLVLAYYLADLADTISSK